MYKQPNTQVAKLMHNNNNRKRTKGKEYRILISNKVLYCNHITH